MATLEVGFEIRDDEPPFQKHSEANGGGDRVIGHAWWMLDRNIVHEAKYGVQMCDYCDDRPASWVRSTIDHPNWTFSVQLCGTCAGDMLQHIPSTKLVAVLQGLEFGYSWEAEMAQDKFGADS